MGKKTTDFGVLGIDPHPHVWLQQAEMRPVRLVNRVFQPLALNHPSTRISTGWWGALDMVSGQKNLVCSWFLIPTRTWLFSVSDFWPSFSDMPLLMFQELQGEFHEIPMKSPWNAHFPGKIHHSSGHMAALHCALPAPRCGPHLPRCGPGTATAESAVAPGGGTAKEAAGRADGGAAKTWGELFIWAMVNTHG